MNRSVATQRCPECRRKFQVLADEDGMHECPSCGYHPRKDYPTPFGCDVFWPEDPLPVQSGTGESCRVCGGSGFVAYKQSIDDGYGEVDSCPACGRGEDHIEMARRLRRPA